jgi:hypothetical protein
MTTNKPAQEKNNLLTRVLETAVTVSQEPPDYGARGFYCRLLLLATLPHSKPEGNVFTRTSGNATLTIMAPPDIGLPYGSYPILLNTWIVTEAIKTKNRRLDLGNSYRHFLREIHLPETGNTMRLFRQQTKRLLASTIHVTVREGEGKAGLALSNTTIASKAILFWDEKHCSQPGLFGHSEIVLSEDYFREIMAHPVPVDLRIITAIKKSPLALNLYMLMTYTYAAIDKPRRIPLKALALQLGADYTRQRAFKEKVIKELRTIKSVYQKAAFAINDEDNVLVLFPSPPSIPHT